MKPSFDEDVNDNTRKRAPPKPRRSRNDMNQRDCGHHDNSQSVVNIPIHTPNGLKSALKKPESKVVNVPIHTSGRSRSRSGKDCPPINIPIHTTEKNPNNREHCPINIPIHTTNPQKERSTIRPWRKSNKEESTVKTWSDYSSNNNTSVRMHMC